VTTAGFNALLKLVEEPPPHVKFIFATTEPDKVIGTIRSRTHHYPFRLVPPRVLTDYLGKLCAAEGIAVEAAVLPLVVRAGAGSVRDSLSVLDQLLGGADEHGVAYQQATALLGYTPDSLLDEFVDAFAAGDAGGVFTCVDKVIEVGQDPRRFAEDLLRRVRDLVIVAAVPDALSSGLVEAAPDQAERLSSQAAALGAGELTRAAEVIAVGLTDMRGTTAPRLHLELMCARVLLPGADVDDRGIHARLDRLERRIGMTGMRPEPGASTVVRPEPVQGQEAGASTSSARITPEPAVMRPEPVEGLEPGEPAVKRPEPVEGQESEASIGPAQAVPDARGPAGGETDDTKLGAEPDPTTPAPGTKFTVTDLRRLWPEVLEEVKGKRRFTWILLSQNAQVAELRGDTLLLSMTNAGARDSFGRGGSEDVLREALVVVLGTDFKIEAMVEPGNASAASARTPPPAAAPPEPAPGPDPAEVRAREEARQSIRPTREDRGAAAAGPDERDEAVSRDDDDLDDAAESHRDLLTRHLGAEIIAEEDAPA
jgi:DNA polymerase-3 subunit gamma/tau